MMHLDRTDEDLIGLLREHARMPTAEIARRLKLSRTTVHARIERLEREGIIRGYCARLSEDFETGFVRAHVMVTCAPRHAGNVGAALKKLREVRALHSVSGPFDLIAIVAARTVAGLDRVIDEIGTLDGVERTTSSIILSTRLDR